MDGERSSIAGQNINSSGSPARFARCPEGMEAFYPRTTKDKKYFKIVGGSNEAFFGLFLLKNYKSLPTRSKKSSITDTGAEDAVTPKQARDKLDNTEDDDKDDNGEMEMTSEADAADAAKHNFKNQERNAIWYKIDRSNGGLPCMVVPEAR